MAIHFDVHIGSLGVVGQQRRARVEHHLAVGRQDRVECEPTGQAAVRRCQQCLEARIGHYDPVVGRHDRHGAIGNHEAFQEQGLDHARLGAFAALHGNVPPDQHVLARAGGRVGHRHQMQAEPFDGSVAGAAGEIAAVWLKTRQRGLDARQGGGTWLGDQVQAPPDDLGAAIAREAQKYAVCFVKAEPGRGVGRHVEHRDDGAGAFQRGGDDWQHCLGDGHAHPPPPP